jgi:hypothetical protein
MKKNDCNLSGNVTIDVCRSPIKKDYTLYINGIRVHGVEPLFEPPLISIEVNKSLISAALQGKTMYDLMKDKET